MPDDTQRGMVNNLHIGRFGLDNRRGRKKRKSPKYSTTGKTVQENCSISTFGGFQGSSTKAVTDTMA